jgi:cysteine desulfurase family protein (TIGR01976 family)
MGRQGLVAATPQFDLEMIRTQFPALTIEDEGVRRIYFDNPAGTQVPATVARAMSDCLLTCNANLGAPFQTSLDADRIVQAAREAMADFLHAASTDEVIFGQNMTTITLHLSRSIGKHLRPGDEIVLSKMEHDANVWPWVMLARDLDLEIRWLPFDTDSFEFDLTVLDQVFTERTRLVCVGGASNLLGTINDVQAICGRARAIGAWSFIDAVQSAPHVTTDVQQIGCDFLICSAYKFFGPHQGILWGRQEILEQLEAYKVRPAPDEPPWSFETGTQSLEGYAGTTAAIDYYARIGESMGADSPPPGTDVAGRRFHLRTAMDLLFDYEKELTIRLVNGLGDIRGVKVQGITDLSAMDRRVPTVSFTHDTVAPAKIAAAMAEQNIFVWSGNNYAVEPAKALGIYDCGGAVRVGPVHYNSPDEIDQFLEALAPVLSA